MLLLPALALRATEDLWWRALLRALQAAGPTFLKLAQWVTTRPDVVAPALVARLSPLQASVEQHSEQDTAAVLDADCPGWRDELELGEVVGSGCVAQVYRGQLKDRGELRPVAVKVAHPAVSQQV